MSLLEVTDGKLGPENAQRIGNECLWHLRPGDGEAVS